jgi:hypothetical protein
LCWRTANSIAFVGDTFFILFLEIILVFRPLWASSFSLLVQRKGTKRKDPRMLALRVPCDARISWRGVNSGYALRQAHPETPAHPALLGKPERDFKVNIKNQVSCNIVGASLGAIV